MPSFPARLDRPVAIGAACWTAAIIFFIGQVVAQATSVRPYSLATNLISDLGNTDCGPSICSPLHLLMDVTFVATGLLHWGGAVALYRVWPDDVRRRVVTVLLAAAGWGLAYAGIFPENLAPLNHLFGAVIGLVALNLGFVSVGWAIGRAVWGLSLSAYLAGAAGLVGLALFLAHGYAPLVPLGVAERIADYPGAAMFEVVGVFLLLRIRTARRLTPSSAIGSA